MIREEIIKEYVKGMDVLDIGSVGQTDAYNLWDILRQSAGSLTGIDTEASNQENVVQGNMETYDFNKQFDVIVAGDVIEHISNQGLFLDNIKKHLKPDGHLIITTPNAKWFTVALAPNPTHTLWHDEFTLRHLLKRHGFKMKSFRYYYGNKKNYNVIFKLLTLRQAMLAICQHDQR